MANFKAQSRYSKLQKSTTRDGTEFLVLRKPLKLSKANGDIFVTINQELLKRPDLISSRAYGRVDLWWVIYEFNGISDPLFELRMGQVLRLPQLDRVLKALAET